MKLTESNGEQDKMWSRPSRTSLLMLSLASAVIYLSLTLLILRYLQETGPGSMFEHGFSFPVQIFAGIGFGLAAAGVIGFIIFRTTIREILRDFTIVDLLVDMRISSFDRIQISFFAGFGEELLFRGALQPLLGVWLTSVLFIALHGYFKFTSAKHILFGALMFALSVALGLLFEWAGLITAMTAHAVYDFTLLHFGHKYGFERASSDQV